MSSHASARCRRRAHDRRQLDGTWRVLLSLSAERRSLARPALFPSDRRCAHGAYERAWVARNFCASLVRLVLPVRSDEGTRTNVPRSNAPLRCPVLSAASLARMPPRSSFSFFDAPSHRSRMLIRVLLVSLRVRACSLCVVQSTPTATRSWRQRRPRPARTIKRASTCDACRLDARSSLWASARR